MDYVKSKGDRVIAYDSVPLLEPVAPRRTFQAEGREEHLRAQYGNFACFLIVFNQLVTRVNVNVTPVGESVTASDEKTLTAIGPDRHQGPGSGREGVSGFFQLTVIDRVVLNGADPTDDGEFGRDVDVDPTGLGNGASGVADPDREELFGEFAAKALVEGAGAHARVSRIIHLTA